jgi:hypothetical protein
MYRVLLLACCGHCVAGTDGGCPAGRASWAVRWNLNQQEVQQIALDTRSKSM